jgi:alcohol dehydrogenase
MGSRVSVRDIPRFIRLYRSGVLPVNELLDGVIGFADLNFGF